MRARRARPLQLTRRETDVLPLILRGFENKNIAWALGISEQGAKEHVSALLEKFGVPNRAALAFEAGTRLELTGEVGVDRSWMQQLFREADAQMWIARGPELRYVAVNRAFQKSVGGRALLGRTMREALPELEGQGIFERVERVYATGELDIQHERAACWDRSRGVECRYVDCVLQPLRADDGSVNGVLSFSVEVTDIVRERERGR